MSRLHTLVIVAFVVLGCGRAGAESETPSNFDAAGYPRHQCRQPVSPYSDGELDRRFFTEELEQYRRCIREYGQAARYDRERIKEAATTATEEFNAFVRGLE